MKQKNNKTKLIIVLFSIVAVTVMLTYLISGKLVLSKGYNNTSDGSNNKVCLYLETIRDFFENKDFLILKETTEEFIKLLYEDMKILLILLKKIMTILLLMIVH